MKRSLLILAVGLGAATAAGCGGKQIAPLPGVNLSGEWKLNRAESGDPGAMADVGGTRRPGMSGPGIGGIGRPPGRGEMGGGAVDPEKMRQTVEVTRTIMRHSEMLTIEQRSTEVRLTYADSFTITLPTNGASIERDWPGVGTVEFKAEWKDSELRIERKVREGDVKVKEAFTRGPQSPRLVSEVSVTGPTPRELKFLRVYENGP